MINVKKFHSWSTTTFVFKLEDMNNEQMRKEIMAREKRKLGFKFDPIQGGGWQSNKDLLETGATFSNLKKHLIRYVNEILSETYVDSATIRMINSWANISRKGEYTLPHIHEEASWSCVYYLTPTGDANLYLKDPRPLEQMDRSHHYLKDPYANVIRKRPFQTGEVILFPSWLEHGVGTNISNSARISIAANFLIEGTQ